jgi:CDP-paratose 2-epimerase
MTSRTVLLTGGCGFIGCNIADALAMRGDRVLILDNLMRGGVQENAHWLKNRHGNAIEIKVADIRDSSAVKDVVARADAIFHLAAQVAVTSSLERPLEDFEINARGTLNVLEAIRSGNPSAPLVFASTNKVYGRLLDASAIEQSDGRYVPREPSLAAGVDEQAPLDLYSPYGCSKGAADQYVRDYARVFGLRTAVMRMSCIYGARQFGTEDQGWIAHFMIQALRHGTITIYGDGLQVRDALHVSDAVSAWLGVLDSIDTTQGAIFNLGGGPENSTSLLELIDRIAQLRNERPDVAFADWRPGDQPWYVSNTQTLTRTIGWRPRVSLRNGLDTLASWLAPRFGGETVAERVPG